SSQRSLGRLGMTGVAGEIRENFEGIEILNAEKPGTLY
ncbi:MAG: hypothetical protein ACI8UO_006457, partial [Verrucomicrobiales bacterium]